MDSISDQDSNSQLSYSCYGTSVAGMNGTLSLGGYGVHLVFEWKSIGTRAFAKSASLYCVSDCSNDGENCKLWNGDTHCDQAVCKDVN